LIDAERVDFIAVPVRDRERAVQFYGETLGLEKNPNSTKTWVEFETGNVTRKLEAAGVEFRGETFDSGVGNGAIFTDPDGNGLIIHRRDAPYADGTQP
jgi:predicted enzyme related to lactoylglutathione lyase